ncbi:MAG: L-threonylcarbamoyladenylate synthase [Candidatus Bathyarchaeia archaeon]
MQIINANNDAIKKASYVVKRGGIIVYPTDTVYGLGCNPFNEEAVKRLIKIKGERNKPLPILASNVKDVEKIALLTPLSKNLIEFFWPGALTIVLKKKPILPNIVTFGLNSVGVRIPKSQFTIELIKNCGGLLIGTSANISGEPPCKSVNEILKQLNKKLSLIDLIIDGGSSGIGIGSTVIDLTNNQVKILREGPISEKEIISAIKKEYKIHDRC